MNSVHLVERLKRAGWGDALLTVLDVVEPVGIIGAQVLYILQPTARLLGDRQDEITALGRLLETPEGIRALRTMIEDKEIKD